MKDRQESLPQSALLTVCIFDTLKPRGNARLFAKRAGEKIPVQSLPRALAISESYAILIPKLIIVRNSMDEITLIDLASDLGYELAMSGAETFRVEESISRVLAAYGLDAEVFAIPNYLIVTVLTQDGQPITRMRRIGTHGNDLDSVEKLSALSRSFCLHTPAPAQARQQLADTLARRETYSPLMVGVGNFLGAAGFCLFFGGNAIDSLCAGACGLLVGFVTKLLSTRRVSQFFITIAAAFFMALLAYGLGAVDICKNPDAATIGALMILVPGLLFTNAMRDIIYGDTNSGINRIVQVFLVAAAIALGTAGAWNLAKALWGMPVSADTILYSVAGQCLFALIGCAGFAILFNIHGPGGVLCALGGGLAWLAYSVAAQLGCSDIVCYFWSALFSSVYSEIMARVRKYPAISYLVVSIFPLIPGAGVYYTMNYAVLGEMERFANQGMHTAAIAGIMAVGILLGSTVFRIYSDWKLRRLFT